MLNQPASVRVERAGQVSEHAIIDVTHWVQVGLWGFTLLFVLKGLTSKGKRYGKSS